MLVAKDTDSQSVDRIRATPELRHRRFGMGYRPFRNDI